jgi:hypothetical protein
MAYTENSNVHPRPSDRLPVHLSARSPVRLTASHPLGLRITTSTPDTHVVSHTTPAA